MLFARIGSAAFSTRTGSARRFERSNCLLTGQIARSYDRRRGPFHGGQRCSSPPSRDDLRRRRGRRGESPDDRQRDQGPVARVPRDPRARPAAHQRARLPAEPDRPESRAAAAAGSSRSGSRRGARWRPAASSTRSSTPSPRRPRTSTTTSCCSTARRAPARCARPPTCTGRASPTPSSSPRPGPATSGSPPSSRPALRFVTFGRTDGSVDHDWVDTDNVAGCRLAAGHLADLGHRSIGFLGWPGESWVGDDRRQGWRDELAARRPRRRPVARRHRHQRSHRCDQLASEQLLASRPDVTAVVAASDELAFGALQAAERAGRRSASSATTTARSPPIGTGLTTIRQPIPEIARRIIALASGLLDPRRPTSRRTSASCPSSSSAAASRRPPDRPTTPDLQQIRRQRPDPEEQP